MYHFIIGGCLGLIFLIVVRLISRSSFDEYIFLKYFLSFMEGGIILLLCKKLNLLELKKSFVSCLLYVFFILIYFFARPLVNYFSQIVSEFLIFMFLKVVSVFLKKFDFSGVHLCTFYQQ